jgi:hypothetical protein
LGNKIFYDYNYNDRRISVMSVNTNL